MFQRLALVLSLALNAVLFAPACGPRSYLKMPRWDGEFLAGDHQNERVVGETGKAVSCKDPEFSDGVWLSYQDVGCLYQQLIQNCRAWKQQQPKCEPVTPEMRKYLDEYMQWQAGQLMLRDPSRRINH